MTTTFPGALDSLANPASTDTLASSHVAQHANINDAIEAVEAKLGITGSGSPEGVVTAAAGSLYADSTAGKLYFKASGSSNTGWSLVLVGVEYGTEAVEVMCSGMADTVTVGDGKAGYLVPAKLNGWNLVRANAALLSAQSSSGLPTIQVRNATDSVDMLSTKITIDANESTSYTAATPSVVDTAHDDVATGDIILIDVDVAGTGAQGLLVVLEFQAP